MHDISYTAALVPVRDDFAAASRRCVSVFIEPVRIRICSGRAAHTPARRLTWPL